MYRVPDFIIPKEAEDIHGISTQEAQDTGIVCGYPLAIITYFISKCHTMIAHNLAFDLQITTKRS
jgi:DNA polymerase III epsilon subunit-like protein